MLVLVFAVKARQYVLKDFVYAGSDSYAYLGAASELVENHRFAMRPAPWHPGFQPGAAPLSYGRLPGYPLLLATLIKKPIREYKDFLPVFGRIRPVQFGLDVLICVLVFFGARFLGGGRAAWPAVLLAATSPFLMLFAASVLTETLATFFSTLALFCLIAGIFDRKRQQRWPRFWWMLGGGAIALSMLVRVDSIMLAPCLLLPALWPAAVGAASRRAGLKITAAALLILVVVFSPWPIRNTLRFGNPHPLGGACDVTGREMTHLAFFNWFATWLEKESDTPDTLFCFFHDGCISNIAAYPPHAFDSAAERARVDELFRLRASVGLNERVDAGFRKLARERTWRHPFRTFVKLPLVRAYYQWTEPADQPMRSSPMVIQVLNEKQRYFPQISEATAEFGFLGLVFLWTRRRARPAALLLTMALAVRTAGLALIGFVENRYLLELLPTTFMLCGLALSAPLSLFFPPSRDPEPAG